MTSFTYPPTARIFLHVDLVHAPTHCTDLVPTHTMTTRILPPPTHLADMDPDLVITHTLMPVHLHTAGQVPHGRIKAVEDLEGEGMEGGGAMSSRH